MPTVSILWDESYIWGLLVVRAVKAMKLPYRLLRAVDAPVDLKADRFPLLLVPGGNARHKADALGEKGREAIREYVEAGGCYIGLCGGAGLALTSREADAGLHICPWRRGQFTDRMQHLMSGHLYMRIPNSCPGTGCEALLPPEGGEHALPESPLLPVWWPGRFSPDRDSRVTVLASYDHPADDFWIADLPIADLPPDTFSAWQDMYGLNLSPAFLAGQPCVIHGMYGQGNYVLSYSHLETPDSLHANRWLAHMLRVLGGFKAPGKPIPAWNPATEAVWRDEALEAMARALDSMIETGLRLGLLFARTPWLLGWRSGLPGANLNNLRTTLSVIREQEPTNEALSFWTRHKERVNSACSLFSKACAQYLLSERLSQTLSKTIPDMLPAELLKDRRDALFGPPMLPGGLYGEIIGPLDELAFLQLSSHA